MISPSIEPPETRGGTTQRETSRAFRASPGAWIHRALVLVGLAWSMWFPAAAQSIDPPHTNSVNICGSCHLIHRAPGGTLTSVAGNANLCMSCHTVGASASARSFADSDQALPRPGLPVGIATGGTSHRWDSGVAGHAEFLGGTSTGTVEPSGAFTGAYAKTYTITITNAGNSGTARFNWTATAPVGGAGTNVLTGTNVALNEGITVTFRDGTNTSFQAGDRWNLYVRSDLRLPTNTVLLTGLATNGQMKCSSCHNEHSQANAPFDPNAPAYTTNNFGLGRHYQRIANDTDQMCVDCHAPRNVTNSLAGSHPVGIGPLTNSFYKRPATLPLDKTEGKIRCSTCHDVHYSAENDGTLVRLTNQVALCTDCHLLADTTTPASHLNRTNSALWPGGQYGSTFPAITDTTLRGACDNCHQAHGWPNATNTATHYSKLLVDTEENVCFTCHDANGPAVRNVKDDFAKLRHHLISDLQQPLGRAVECRDCHNPHMALSGSHTYTNTATLARNRVSNPLKGVSGVVVNYTGLGNFVAPAAGNYTLTNNAAYEYQICLKCHSGYAYGTNFPAGLSPYYSTGTANFTNGSTTVRGTSTAWVAGMVGSWIRRTNDVTNYKITAVGSGTSLTITPAYAGGTGSAQLYVITLETDLAQEFSPMNRSGHPIVTGLDNYPNSTAYGSPAKKGLQAARMKAPWNVNVGQQTMMCSDCHNTDAATPAAQGPHGSATRYMLRGANAANWPNVTIQNYNTSWCANCHINGGGQQHTDHHNGRQCYQCHVVIPHGSKMSRLIADNDTMPSRYAWNNTRNTQYIQGFTKAATGSYGESNCRAQCSEKHNARNPSENW